MVFHGISSTPCRKRISRKSWAQHRKRHLTLRAYLRPSLTHSLLKISGGLFLATRPPDRLMVFHGISSTPCRKRISRRSWAQHRKLLRTLRAYLRLSLAHYLLKISGGCLLATRPPDRLTVFHGISSTACRKRISRKSWARRPKQPRMSKVSRAMFSIRCLLKISAASLLETRLRAQSTAFHGISSTPCRKRISRKSWARRRRPRPASLLKLECPMARRKLFDQTLRKQIA
jgi:hypothetical protein